VAVLNLVRVEHVLVIDGEGLGGGELEAHERNEVEGRLDRWVGFSFGFHFYRDSKVVEDEDPLVKVEFF
jgi:hypothetical protein